MFAAYTYNVRFITKQIYYKTMFAVLIQMFKKKMFAGTP